MRYRWGALVVFFAAFGFYVHGLYPTVSVGDAGELITAARTLSIPHEPGYPAYTVLSRCITDLLPWGNPGYRQNVFSALCASAAAALIFLVLIHAGLTIGSAFLAAGLFVLAPASVASAQASEVFMLNALFTAGVLAALIFHCEGLAGLLLGIGLGNHQTMLFLIPAVAWFMLSAWDVRRVKAFGSFCLLGLGVYLVLYFRAGRHPFLNIGDPDSLHNLWRVISRADYGTTTLAIGKTPARNFANLLLQARRFAVGLSGQLTWAGVGLCFVGFMEGWFHHQRPIQLMVLAFFVTGPFFFLLANLPFDAQSDGLLQRFYVVPILCAGGGIAYAVDFLLRQKRTLSWLVALGLIPLGLRAASALSSRSDFMAWSFGMNHLQSLPRDSILIIDGGDDTFYSLAYLTQVEKRRPDVELHDRGGVVFSSLYGDDFRGLPPQAKEDRRRSVESSLVAGPRQLVYSTMNDRVLETHALRQTGIVYQASRAENTAPAWPFYDLRGIAPWMEISDKPLPDYRTRALAPYYVFQRAVDDGRHKRFEAALQFLAVAHSVGPDVLWLIPNIGTVLELWAYAAYQRHDFATARSYYDRLTEWYPSNAGGWINRAAVFEAEGHLEDAISNNQKAIKVDPSSVEAHFNLAVCFWKQRNWPGVIDQLHIVLSLDPSHQEARRYLAAAQQHRVQGE